ncbi:hypothetical protein CcaverHIS002_0702010 [Cutaneotrichosporon cavernicola]|nr:hypothetical protein CcaverHIS002_0702010 [Cutaneotrichosporon cavernicola]
MPELFNTTRLQGKTAIITGASGGIGASTAILFARAGCNLVLLARRKEALEEVAAQAKAAAQTMGQNPQIVVRTLDVNDRTAVDALVPALKRPTVSSRLTLGTERVGDIKMNDVDFMVDTNLVSLIQVTQAFLPEMKRQDSGHILNIGSLAGREAYVGGAVYCATKHAVKAFTQSLLKELVATGIRVTEVAPGFVETNFSVIRFRGNEDAAKAVYKGFDPLVAEDIAEEIVWCAMRPPHVQIAELFVLPSAQGSATILHRKE